MTDLAKDMLEFNSRLLESYTSKKDFRDYFQSAYSECIGKKVTPAFLDDFVEMSLKTGIFVVDQEMLFKYKVITTGRSNDVLGCLMKFDLQKDKDYRVREVSQPVKQGGYSVKKVYVLTQDAFKICLMRAKNSWEYAMYFITLERIVNFYYKYMEAYDAKLLATKDDKIDTLTSETKELRNKVDEQTKKINDLLSRTDHIIEQNDNLSIDNTYLTSKVDQLEETVDDVRDAFRETLDDRNPRPESPALQHYFVLLKERKKDNVYKYIRSQSKTIDKKLRDYSHSHDVIISKRYNANPIDMYNRFKKNVESDNNKIVAEIKALKLSKDEKEILTNELIKNPPIKCRYNDITICLDKISEKDLVQRIEACDSEKLNVVIP